MAGPAGIDGATRWAAAGKNFTKVIPMIIGTPLFEQIAPSLQEV